MVLYRKLPLFVLPFFLASAAQARIDNTDLPFADDPAVLGRWISVAYVPKAEQFNPAAPVPSDLFFKGLAFLPGGKLERPGISWTKGLVLNPAAGTASAYTFKKIGGVEYMFFEWKSGDYTVRDMEPGYYVLVREKDYARMAGAKKKPAERETRDCLNPGATAGVCRRPAAWKFDRGPLKALPAYVPDSGDQWQMDLRGRDLSALDLSGRAGDLLYADFDGSTKFPAALPPGFDPAMIMELGKNPGLGVRALHRAGLTGKGVSIAIIDQPLLTTHREYADKLRSYEELHMFEPKSGAAMHGAAVASIAVGRTCGVAPDAELYYVATDFSDGDGNIDYRWLAKAIDRLLAISGSLPAAKRIRAVSISRGFRRGENGAEELLAAIGRAKKAGVLVLTTSPGLYYDFDFTGLGRDPLADPDKPASYGPGLFWRKSFLAGGFKLKETLLVPMDSRTTASPAGDEDYVFYRSGGMSWSVPYIAGLYALACQTDPGTTPESFLKKALESARPLRVSANGGELVLEKVADPARLLKESAGNAVLPKNDP
jgi:hypothetical protein